MSHRFHSFRAPTTNSPPFTKHTSLPLPSVSSRKAATRFARDAAFGIRSLSKSQLIAVSATVVIVVLLCCRSSSTEGREYSRKFHPFRTTECACPIPRTSEIFVHQVLNTAGFVAKVRTKNSTAQFVVFEISELFRGHIRAVQWPLVAHQSSTVCCGRAEEVHKESTLSNQEWLLIAGGISSSSDATYSGLSASLNYENFSTVLPGKLKGPRCDTLTKEGSDESSGQGIVWVTPWTTLSQAVIDNILRDSENEPLWWRTNDATMEFKDAVDRAVVASRAHNSLESTNDNAPGLVTSGSKEWWIREGVSVVAACKDRSDTLKQAILTWLVADGVDEIIVVDWSSDPSIIKSLTDEILADPRLVIVRADGQSQWVLSRAYNLAARAASFSKLMKVDCDTVLTSDFFKTHDLRRDRFFAGNWRQLESGASNALHTNGLLYVYRDDFLAVGGFDERITTYGWDDSDLAERLSKLREPHTVVNNKVRHISHSASLRVTNQPKNSLLPPSNPFAAAVEIQRNRLLLTKFNLPGWRAASSHVVWNVLPETEAAVDNMKAPEASVRSGVFLRVKEANDVTSASVLVSDADAEEVAKKSIRVILRRLGLPSLPKTLTLEFCKTLIAKVASPDKYAEVALSLQGGCASKLLSHISSKEATLPGSLMPPGSAASDSFVPPPYPYQGWRLLELWPSSDSDCTCSFSSIFDATDEEVLTEWLESGNIIHTNLSARVPQALQQNVANILRSFSELSTLKNVSIDVSKWYQGIPSSKILVADSYCSANPMSLSKLERARIRQSLTKLVPSALILKNIRSSLAINTMSVLDSPLLDIHKQSSLVSETLGSEIKESLTTVESAKMLATWTSQPLATDTDMLHDLSQRARAVMLSTFMAENGWNNSQTSPSASEKLKHIVAEVSQVVKPLFKGCVASPYEYFGAYPELSVVVAGFFSARICL